MAPVARKRFRLVSGAWTLAAIAFLLLFFVAPLVDNALRNGLQPGLYAKLLTDSYYLRIIGETLWVSLVVVLACIVVGYPVAYYFVRFARRSQVVILFLLVAPLLISSVMRTFGWSVIFARQGPVTLVLRALGYTGQPIDIADQPIAVYIGLVHIMVPFMVLSISSVLQNLDTRLEEAARALGASRWRAFQLVTLPLSLEGLLTGSILVFMLTNGTFVTMLFLGAGRSSPCLCSSFSNSA